MQTNDLHSLPHVHVFIGDNAIFQLDQTVTTGEMLCPMDHLVK